MLKHVAIAGALFVASPALAQTTHCTTMGNTTNCVTDNSVNQGQAGVNTAMQGLINSTRPVTPMRREEAAPSLPRAPGDTPEERRANAYAQVGALIAKGDCDGAMRLANFYGRPDIVADTAKACQR